VNAARDVKVGCPRLQAAFPGLNALRTSDNIAIVSHGNGGRLLRSSCQMEPRSNPGSRILRFGVFEVDLRSSELRKHGTRIGLQDQPFKILALLIEQPGEIITRNELRQKLWPADTFVNFDRSLNKAINKVRTVLGDSAESPRFVETVPRHGYRFIAPVEGVDAPSSPPASLPPEARVERADASVAPIAAFAGARAPAGLRSASLLGLALVLVAAAAAALHWRSALLGASSSSKVRRSVAVLGFRNLSGRTDEAWLSTALSDWLTTELAAGEQLRAVPRERVEQMKAGLALPESPGLDRATLDRIRHNLGADLVVAGSYAVLDAKFGGQIRLDLQVEDTRSGETLAAVSETEGEGHLSDLVSHAGAVLRARLGVDAVTAEQAAEVGHALPANPAAARLYSEGLAKLRLFDALSARDSLDRAAALEPGSALVHSALSAAWAALGYDEAASAEARRAFDLSATLPRADRLLIEARYREAARDWDKAIEIYRALCEFFPDNLDYGLALTGAQVSGGRGKDALSTAAALEGLGQPFRDDPRIDLAAVRAEESQGDFRAVQADALRGAAKARAAGDSLLLAQARMDEAWALENLGRPADAVPPADEARRLCAGVGDQRCVARATTVHAIALDLEGDAGGAQARFEEALQSSRAIGNLYGVATSLNNIGDTQRALGDLAGALHNFRDSLALYREIGNQGGVALTESNLGDVFLALGHLTDAQAMYQDSLRSCLATGDRSKQAQDLAGLGSVMRAEGNLNQAISYKTQAAAAFEASGEKRMAAEARLGLARLRLDQGEIPAAATAARQAAHEFEREGVAGQESMAQAVLAEALLKSGNASEAQQALARAVRLSDRCQDREAGLLVAVTAARVRAASGRAGDLLQAERNLRQTAREAATSGFLDDGLEARLTLAELEMSSENPAGARASLEEIQRDAAGRGFGLIAEKAAAALRTSPSQEH
jgi:DNA-binding winged helix-turn-helix (wHTH) protein/tetratricopeptide (TPR) repeat protein/TolB-like protein